MNSEKLKIKCTLRRYLIKSGEVEIEIESPKPLEGEDIQSILEIDAILETPLKDLLPYAKIVSRISEKKEKKNIGKIPEKKKYRKKIYDVIFSPKERITILSNMEAPFSRLDYHRYMQEKFKMHMSNFMSHNDIEEALKNRIIESTGQKVINPETKHRVPTYRVIEKLPIDEHLNKIFKERGIKNLITN